MFMKGRAGVSAILWPNKATGAKRKPLSGLEGVPYGGERWRRGRRAVESKPPHKETSRVGRERELAADTIKSKRS